MPYCQPLFAYMAVTERDEMHIFYYILRIKI